MTVFNYDGPEMCQEIVDVECVNDTRLGDAYQRHAQVTRVCGFPAEFAIYKGELLAYVCRAHSLPYRLIR